MNTVNSKDIRKWLEAQSQKAILDMDKGITTTYTYDEVDFKRIDGLAVIRP